MTEVKLFKQTLKELIETDELFKDREDNPISDALNEHLELVCMVSTSSTYGFGSVNGDLRKEAEKLLASYVFGVNYIIEGSTILAYGDAYKVKSNK